MEKTLAPKVEAKISKNVRLKFKARILQRKGKVIIDNSYVDSHIDVTTSGDVDVHLSKKLKKLGLSKSIEYDVDEGIYMARIDKQLTRNISTTLSSSQKLRAAPFGRKSDTTLRINYTSRFP